MKYHLFNACAAIYRCHVNAEVSRLKNSLLFRMKQINDWVCTGLRAYIMTAINACYLVVNF